jgi:hypothetical protein
LMLPPHPPPPPPICPLPLPLPPPKSILAFIYIFFPTKILVIDGIASNNPNI